MKNKTKKIWLDNHEARIKALESICTHNESSSEIIRTSNNMGIKFSKWYIICLMIIIQIYIIIRISI